MFETNVLFASLIWGGIGSGMLVYGWRQKSAMPIAGGLALTGVSYFVASALYMSVASVAIMVIMYGLKKQGY